MRAVVDDSAVQAFLAAAAEVAAGTTDPLTAWIAYEQQHAEVFARYLDGWGDASRRTAAATAMTRTADRLRASAVDWPTVVDQVTLAMNELVGTEAEIPVVVFVGMHTSNGWVTELRGRRTVFVAAEFAPPATAAGLLAHELTHAVQGLIDAAWDCDDYPVGAHTFVEGLATHVSTLVVPGRTDDEYLWFDTGRRAAWLNECEQAWAAAAGALAQVIDEPCGGAAERRFFAFRPDTPDPLVPSRFGYYAGLRIVRNLARELTVAELLRLDVATAQSLVRSALAA